MHDNCTKYKLQKSILTSLRFITQFSTANDIGVEAYDIIHVVFFPFLNILYQYITSVQIKLCCIYRQQRYMAKSKYTKKHQKIAPTSRSIGHLKSANATFTAKQ